MLGCMTRRGGRTGKATLPLWDAITEPAAKHADRQYDAVDAPQITDNDSENSALSGTGDD
jgi:hypothetical protein